MRLPKRFPLLLLTSCAFTTSVQVNGEGFVSALHVVGKMEKSELCTTAVSFSCDSLKTRWRSNGGANVYLMAIVPESTSVVEGHYSFVKSGELTIFDFTPCPEFNGRIVGQQSVTSNTLSWGTQNKCLPLGSVGTFKAIGSIYVYTYQAGTVELWPADTWMKTCGRDTLWSEDRVSSIGFGDRNGARPCGD